MKIPLDNRTVLLGDSINNILNRVQIAGRKGIDIRLYTVNKKEATGQVDIQTVATFLASMQNPNIQDRKSKQDIDRLISNALEDILISDRVRSSSDFYKTNARDSDRSNSLVVDFNGQKED